MQNVAVRALTVHSRATKVFFFSWKKDKISVRSYLIETGVLKVLLMAKFRFLENRMRLSGC